MLVIAVVLVIVFFSRGNGHGCGFYLCLSLFVVLLSLFVVFQVFPLFLLFCCVLCDCFVCARSIFMS